VVVMLASELESSLVSRAQQGDHSAYGELVWRHYPGVVNVVYRMCGDSHLAEDAAQDAFIQAWLHLPSYRPQTPLRGWLYRIAINAALDFLRREAATTPHDIETLTLVSPGPDPEAITVDGERADQVRRAVMSLPPASRAVLILREYEGFSYQQTAKALDIPIGTVMSRLNYARQCLRKLLDPQLLQSEVYNE
jgi:RNA polymerase sigma-70 factor (ECF subfamily)